MVSIVRWVVGCLYEGIGFGMGYSIVLQCGLLYLGKISVRVLCFVFVYNVLTRKVGRRGRRELVQITKTNYRPEHRFVSVQYYFL